MTEKVAIVTAASKGMGAACATELSEQGYQVVMMARHDEINAVASSINAVGFIGSVTEPDDLQRLVSFTEGQYGRIDAVVNNTGHPPKGELLELSDEDWHNSLDLLLLNVVRMARLVTPIMQKQGGGAFVNISTFGALEPSLKFPISSSLRSALAGYAKLFADRYASENIRMNNILPGYIDSYETDEATINSIPAKRKGKVQEIAKTTAFLLSDGAGYITGQNIRVDGGLTYSI